MDIHFTWGISFGQILTGLGLIVTILRMHNSNQKKLAKMEEQLSSLYSWYELWRASKFNLPMNKGDFDGE